MRSANTRLSLLPFVQNYDGANLSVRLLMLPSGSPLSALDATNPAGPSFATAPLQLSVVLTSGLAAMPPSGAQTVTAQPAPAPPQAEALFDAMAAQFNIDPAPPAAQPGRASTNIKKYLPPSYRIASGLTRSRTPFAVTDDSYCCTRKTKPVLHKLPDPAAPVPWGKVIAAALRQPVLAEALGLVRPLVVAVPGGALDKGDGCTSPSTRPVTPSWAPRLVAWPSTPRGSGRSPNRGAALCRWSFPSRRAAPPATTSRSRRRSTMPTVLPRLSTHRSSARPTHWARRTTGPARSRRLGSDSAGTTSRSRFGSIGRSTPLWAIRTRPWASAGSALTRALSAIPPGTLCAGRAVR